MRRASWVVVAFALVPLCAQDRAALVEREASLTARAVQGLHSLADGLQAQRQHQRALSLRRELIEEYDQNDPKARQKCGFTMVGDQWRRDGNLLVLDKDVGGDKKVLRKIDQEMDALARDLGAEHRALAEGWAGLDEASRALRHWQRVHRWLPSDKPAIAALALSEFEGFRGTPTELDMLRRARTIRGAVEWLHRSKVAVALLQGEQHPLLAAAGLGHLGVRTEHFEVWGAMPEPMLVKLAEYAERSLLLCHTLMGTHTGAVFEPHLLRGMVFVPSAEAYHTVLDGCAGQFDAGRLKFLKDDVDQAFVDAGGKSWRLYKIVNGEAVALDQCVRGVVQDALGVMTNGIWEGIGHAACGFLFGRTLTFLLEQQTQQTSASAPSTPLLPDLDTWRKMAEESAWARSDTRTSELVLLSAAKFTNEQRVKAWAMCDYLMHRHPEWMLELDKSQAPAIRTPPDVEREFLRRTKVELPYLDSEWRDYWAKQAPLRAAMVKDPVAAEQASERAALVRARTLVDAVNDARAAANRGPVGFFASRSAAVAAATAYTEQLTKAEAEQKRKPKVVVPMPPLPPSFGVSVLWSRRATPSEAVDDWLQQPAQRDILMHPGRGLCGSAVAPSLWALDVALPALDLRRGPPLSWPRHEQKDVRGSAKVGDLGARAVQALTAAGKQRTDLVGMPLSLHFTRSLPREMLAGVSCRVFAGNLPVDGMTIVYAGEPGEADSADGCVAFVPLQPLAPGASIDVQWTEATAQDGSRPLPRVRFTVK